MGTWIPIVSEAEARAHADDFLVLPWHFMDEIQMRERDFLARGGKLVGAFAESARDYCERMERYRLIRAGLSPREYSKFMTSRLKPLRSWGGCGTAKAVA